MSKVLRRPKGTPRRQREEDPDIIKVLDQISVLTPSEKELEGLLQHLIAQEQLEVVEGTDLEQLSIRGAEALGELRSAKAKARALSAWLLDQPEVEDLYLDDDELARLIANR